MNQFVLAFFVLCAAIAYSSAAPPATKTYTTKYDNVDIEEILKNDRLLEGYFKCLMDKGKCTPDGAELKKVLPDALKNKCSLCSEKQKAGSEKIIPYLIENKPEMWNDLEAKFDPKGTYRSAYKPEADKRGFKLPASKKN